MRLNKHLIPVFLLILLNSLYNCTSHNKVPVSPEDDVKAMIEASLSGDIIEFQPGLYLNTPEIFVPNGVSIVGVEGAIIRRTQSFKGRPIFNISNASAITIKDLNIELFSNSKAIYSKSESTSNDIELDNISIKGNLYDDSLDSNFSSIAITLENIMGLNISNIEIIDNWGGIYLSKISQGTLENNSFKRVNFGNIVLSDSDNINVDNNRISQAGKGSRLNHPSGDGITISGVNSNFKIQNNTISNGYCYSIWVVGSLNDSMLIGNTFNANVTTALCIDNGSSIVIENNTFNNALANGILLNKDYKQILIKNNIFNNDAVISRNNNASDIKLVGNKFENNYYSDQHIGGIGNFSLNEGNTYSTKGYQVSEMILSDAANTKVAYGGTYTLKQAKAKFTILNLGSTLNFTGFPQIILGGSILAKNNRGPRKSGASHFKGLYIGSRMQPNVLSLEQNEKESFTVQKEQATKTNDTIVVNIPTSHEAFNPFWFKIVVQ